MPVYSTLGMIKRQMEVKDARYWTVADSNDNIIATSPKNVATMGVEGSFEDLEKVGNECSGDYVRVSIKTKEANVDEVTGEYKLGPKPKGSSVYGPYFIQCTPPRGGGGGMNGFNGNGGDINLHKQ